MPAVSVELRNVVGTQAAMGWAGAHTIIVDRPEGRAGGMGLGFNGAQLLGLAIGGCFCNDLRYVADEMAVQLGEIEVTVVVNLAGDPLLATDAQMRVRCETLDGSDGQLVIARAKESCMVSNSLRKGVAVTIEAAG